MRLVADMHRASQPCESHLVRESLTHRPYSNSLPIALCVQGHAPQHQRFPEKKIPNHITYAYQKDVEILRNDKFYAWTKNGQPKKIDLLFLISNAPVSTVSEPESGSESYLGVAVGMQMAMKSLSEKFPSFFVEAK